MFRRRFLTMVVILGILFTQFIPRASAKGLPRQNQPGQLCDVAKFIADITLPSVASFPPGASFVKIWRLQNIGTCTWTPEYSLRPYSNESMGFGTYNLPRSVAPGEMVDISINLVAPATGGYHDGTWLLSNASGVRFQVGPGASMPIWVTIFVVQSDMVAFDFVANAPYARWNSSTGTLPYPGTPGDSRGYAYQVNNPKLEDGTLEPQPGLLTVPQNKFNGYIQATYPEFLVHQGDRFQTTVNCEYGATGCYAAFRLDYREASGAIRTFWQYKEAYEGRVYRADIDLSPLAGRNVQFILMTLAIGTASGDRAIWGSPRILRLGGGMPVTPLPPLTPTQTPFDTPPTVSPANCDKASFVADVRVPDGTLFTPGAAFSKTWRLKNSGSCTWTTSYSIVFYSGHQMGASTAVNFPYAIPPGETVDLTVNMVAPALEGEYRGFWILRNSSGNLFGIGNNADSPFWVDIHVKGEHPTEMGYDFWANACSAQWKSGAGILPCPGPTDLNPNGLVIKANYTQLEDGTMGPAPSLLMAPNNKYNGYIQGTYPAFTVQPGDRFVSTVGCEYGSSCYVTFRLDYMTATGAVKTFWTWREQNEGLNHAADISLTPLVGQSVRFMLTILATGSAAGDRVRWVAPYILRAGTPTPPSLTPEQTGLIIRGRVTKDGVGLPNVSIYRNFAVYPGQLVATTDANGYYVSDFWFIPGDEMVSVWAVQEGYTFDPPSYYWRHYHSREERTLDFTASLAPTATPTPTTLPPDWLGYTNSYGFQFRYPPRLEDIPPQNPNYYRIDLPFDHNTNLIEKYLEVFVVENANPCQSPHATQLMQASENVTINGISFLKQTGGDAGMSHLHEWVAYSTLRGNACISMDFMLHSVAPGVYATPPPVFDKAAESAVFSQIMSTFAWLDTTATPTPSPTAGNNLLPDLIIGGMAMRLEDPSCLKPSGNVMGFSIGILNQGQSAALSFMVEVNGVQQPVNGLGIGETTVLFFPGGGNPVTAIVDPTSMVAESDETNNARTEMVPVPTPPLPCTETPTFTPSPTPTGTPMALVGPYAVTLVGYGVLEIRSGPGVSNPVIGSFARDAVNVMRTGLSQQADGAEWVEVILPDGIGVGWVNFNYLTEYVPRGTFCADPRILPLIDQLRQSVTLSDGALLGSLVSPKHGFHLNYWASSPTVNYNAATVQSVFTDPQVLDWGSGGGSGVVDTGTFAQIVQPQMVEVLNSAYQLNCDALSYGQSYTDVARYADTNIHFYSVIKPPAMDFDWKVWLVRVEYVNGQPYLFGAVHYVWEP
jgi:hypothetical protein